jgi:hypothetical protein
MEKIQNLILNSPETKTSKLFVVQVEQTLEHIPKKK